MNAVSFRMIWAIAFGGATGTVSRYLLSQWMMRFPGAFPLGTFAINVAGSFLIALFARVFSTPDSNPVLRAALTVGFCGGFTTFSTFSAEFVTLVQEGRTTRAALYVTASVLTGVLAVLAGLAVGNRWVAVRG
jgi:CrcB protein